MPETARKEKSPIRSAWDLPDLARPLHRPRQRRVKQPRMLRHYPAVVEFVYNHRFATTFHIQRRFHEYMRTPRTSQYQLANLIDLGYLQRAPVRSTSPNFPSVYATTHRGIRLIREVYAKHGVQWQGDCTEQLKVTGVALDSILHELLLTEFDEALRTTVESRGDLSLEMHERRYFQRNKQLYYPHEGRVHRLIPDAGFLIRMTTSQTSGRSCSTMDSRMLIFVEFDNGTMSATRIAEKYRAYERWNKSDEAKEYLARLNQMHKASGRGEIVSFRLLVVAHSKNKPQSDHRRLMMLFAEALSLPRALRERIWLTTVSDLRRPYRDAAPFADPIWVRVRDARGWIGEYRKLRLARPKDHGIEVLGSRIESLPRHCIFKEA